MKQSGYYFSVTFLFLFFITNFAMEKEPSDNSFFSKSTSTFTSLFNKKDDTPTEHLKKAIETQNLSLLQAVLKQGADCNTTMYNESRKINLSPLHYAVQYNNYYMIKALLDAGAKPFDHQSLIVVDARDIFPLSLLPLPYTFTPSEKCNRLLIIKSFATTIKEKKLKTDYFIFVQHIRMLTEIYKSSETSYSSAAAHIKDQLEIVKVLNTYIISFNDGKKPELIPNHKETFHLIKILVEERREINPNHPMVELYDHLANPMKDYNDIVTSINNTFREYKQFKKDEKSKQEKNAPTELLIDFSEWHEK